MRKEQICKADLIVKTNYYLPKHNILHSIVAVPLSTYTKVYYYTCKNNNFELCYTRTSTSSPKQVIAKIRQRLLHIGAKFVEGSTLLNGDNPKLDLFETFIYDRDT